jgi:high affinity sulfate transporter 1
MQISALVPAAVWLRRYPRAWLRPDVLAGLAAAAVVVPKAMAYATIAGLPVEVGLYTALVPMVVYAFLGTSRPLSVSTTTTIAILSAAALDEVAPGAGAAELMTASVTLAVMVGVLLIAARLLGLGFVANFISEPVLTGFKSGIGLVIVVDQVPKLFGIHFDKAGFFHNVASIVQHVPQTSIPTLLLATGVLLVIGGFERFLPRLPVPLIAVGLAIAASALFGLEARGVALVGAVPDSLPSLHWPDLQLASKLWADAAGIALMSFTETIAAARAFAEPGEPRLVPNQELLAVGLANVVGGLFGAMAAGGGTSQTAVNRHAGAKSQVAELATATGALATILLVAPYIAVLPTAALGAVVIAYSVGLIQPREFMEIRAVRTREFRWALIAFAGVVLLGTLQGILVAVVASLLTLIHQVYNPPVYALARKRGTTAFRPVSDEHADDEQWPGLLLVRVEGRVFFANAQRVGELLWQLVEAARPKVIVLDGRAIIDLEYTAIKMLREAEERLRRDGIELWLAGLNPGVQEAVQRSSVGRALGPGRIFLNLEAAVTNYQERADA